MNEWDGTGRDRVPVAEEVGARILIHLKRAAESSLNPLRRLLGFTFGSLTVGWCSRL